MAPEYLGVEMTDTQAARARQVRAQLEAAEAKLQPHCAHEGYSLPLHGRHCPSCHALMVDFGD